MDPPSYRQQTRGISFFLPSFLSFVLVSQQQATTTGMNPTDELTDAPSAVGCFFCARPFSTAQLSCCLISAPAVEISSGNCFPFSFLIDPWHRTRPALLPCLIIHYSLEILLTEFHQQFSDIMALKLPLIFNLTIVLGREGGREGLRSENNLLPSSPSFFIIRWLIIN